MQYARRTIADHLRHARGYISLQKGSPDEVWEELFQDVQLRHIFPDSMTFADMIPATARRKIIKKYRAERQNPDFDLASFVAHNFNGLIDRHADTPKQHHDIETHIEELWPVLRRENRKTKGSLLGLPRPYLVAGGRFAAQYYWDSYFIMLGLAAGGHWDMVEDMLKNWAYLIRTYGFAPNGSRTYYLTRSQPPVFALMVRLLAQKHGRQVLVRYLPHLLIEHRFWMKGASRLAPERRAVAHTVRLPDGAVLNRYYDSATTPRPEGYKEDMAIAVASGRTASKVYLDLRAGAESGWDYSSRWLRDDQNLATIHTTDLAPIDLNSLLYILEETIADAYDSYKQKRLARYYHQMAAERAAAINKYCWDEHSGFYFDYDIVADARSNKPTAAALFPLFAGLADQPQADKIASMVYTKFLQPGGVVTTLHESGQQWDWPNGWAPLQWVAIHGLRQYGHDFLAEEIKERWINTNLTVYHRRGKLIEKYNVVTPQQAPQAGEYPLQDGFGWTNGVLLALLREDKPDE